MNDETEAIKRVNRLFWQKLVCDAPGHPWLAREDAQAARYNIDLGTLAALRRARVLVEGLREGTNEQ